jgi:geranylgeranyl diphosphate synthase type I
MPWDAHPLPDSALAATDELMRELARGDVPGPLGEIAVDALSTGGKRLRARLALTAAESLGADAANAIPVAAAVELIHNASLIHDDLQDGDEVRRGRPTIWFTHGASQAISAGDLMLMLPFRAVNRIRASGEVRFGIARRLAFAVEEMARGQALELSLQDEVARGRGIEAYLRCVEGKTGALFEAPVEAAALLAGLDEERAARIARPFRELGVLFQIQDDVLDLWGDKGRGVIGNDIREGKISYLVALHLARCPDDQAWLLEILGRPREVTTDAEVDHVIERFVSRGTQRLAAQEVTRRALAVDDAESLRDLPGLRALAATAISRTLAPIHHLFDANREELPA